MTRRILVVEAATGLARACLAGQPGANPHRLPLSAQLHHCDALARSTGAFHARLQACRGRRFRHALRHRGPPLEGFRPRVFDACSRPIGAPFSRAPKHLRLLFDPELIEDVFVCREFAFDWTALRDDLQARLAANGVPVRMGETVETTLCEPDRVIVRLASGQELTTNFLFNVTYANINNLALRSGLAPLALKHELAEVALVEPPPELARLAVTVMDGPFFSSMPYPAEKLYSLAHVRYTPHFSWVDSSKDLSPYQITIAFRRYRAGGTWFRMQSVSCHACRTSRTGIPCSM